MNGEQKPKIPWWMPGAKLFLRLSGWIVFPVIAAVFVGKFLDKTFHSAPWIFLLTVAVSFIFSIVKIVKIGLKEIDK